MAFDLFPASRKPKHKSRARDVADVFHYDGPVEGCYGGAAKPRLLVREPGCFLSAGQKYLVRNDRLETIHSDLDVIERLVRILGQSRNVRDAFHMATCHFVASVIYSPHTISESLGA